MKQVKKIEMMIFRDDTETGRVIRTEKETKVKVI